MLTSCLLFYDVLSCDVFTCSCSVSVLTSVSSVPAIMMILFIPYSVLCIGDTCVCVVGF